MPGLLYPDINSSLVLLFPLLAGSPLNLFYYLERLVFECTFLFIHKHDIVSDYLNAKLEMEYFILQNLLFSYFRLFTG